MHKQLALKLSLGVVMITTLLTVDLPLYSQGITGLGGLPTLLNKKAYTIHSSDFGHFWYGDVAAMRANPDENYTWVRFSGRGTLHSPSPAIKLPNGTRIRGLRASAEFSQNCVHSELPGREAWESNSNHAEVMVSLIRTSIRPNDGFEYGRTAADLLPPYGVIVTPSSPEAYENVSEGTVIRTERSSVSAASSIVLDLTRYYYHVVVNVQKGEECQLKLHPISILYD
ncbi:MAG: hypothetical protein HYW02_07440 [Deltaproteobacteria bacterium]|nr:hypothetical protein [Deltaproteobacteria bacterium]MBI4196493.1 hypothetical protein [Deltaproteobacteria bacterium]